MNSAAAPSPELTRHLERAAEWRLMAQIFSYPDEGWAARMELLFECIGDARVAPLGRAALREAGPELWMRLFGPSGPVRVRAVAWEGGLQPGYLLAELAAYYEAFGYEPPASGPPDQLAVLLDFAGWLELKLAYACVRGDSEAREVTARSLETFLARFVAAVAWRVFRQMENEGPGFFAATARLAAERAGPEPERRGWKPDAWPDTALCDDGVCEGPAEIVDIRAHPAGES